MVMGELELKTQVLVIGAGPGGYAAAFRAADLGLDVTMVDAAPRPGGVCLFSGCIPSKTLLFLAQLIHDARRAESMGVSFGPARVDLKQVRQWRGQVIEALARELVGLSRRRGVQLIRGVARFEDAHTVRLQEAEVRRIVFEQAVIATGSRPVEFTGTIVSGAGNRIWYSNSALALAEVPQKLLIIGGGFTGLELGTIYATLGSQVTLAEMGDRLLPTADPDLVTPLERRLESLFASIRLNTRIDALRSADDAVEVIWPGDPPATAQRFDRVLVAIGRKPNTEALGLEQTRVGLDPDGFIRVDALQRTDEPSLLAVGDVTGSPLLAHKAFRQGKVAAEAIAGQPAGFDPQAIAAVVYTDPQIAWCGLTEAAARREGRPVKIERFPWKYSDRAASMGTPEGLTKIITDPHNGRILGAGMVGRQAEALISEAVLAVEMGALAEDMALSIHPYPTLSETEAEAAELFLGGTTHLLPRKK
jgi:dihydrolipoamide dehydrogenase